MKRPSIKIMYIVIIIVLICMGIFVVTKLNWRDEQESPSPSINSNNIDTTAEIETYLNKKIGITFNYPKGMQTWEISPDELVNSDLYYFGNSKPDLTIEVGVPSDRRNGIGKKKSGNGFLMAFYKKTIAPELLLKNYNKSTPKKISISNPSILSSGVKVIGGVKYEEIESITGENYKVHSNELAANLQGGWTVYAIGMSGGGTEKDYNNLETYPTMVAMLESLRINNGIFFNTLGWKTCKSKNFDIELLYPPTMECVAFASPGETVFDIVGTYTSGNGGSVLLKEERYNYRIGLTKDKSLVNNFLDKKYSCYEGSCPNYPVSLSKIQIGKNIFSVSQADTPIGDKYPDLSERTIKMLGMFNDWIVYSTQLGISYQLGVAMPVETDFSQRISQEIINSIKLTK